MWEVFIAALFIITPTKYTLMFISRRVNYANYAVECHAIVTYICSLD